MKRLFIILLCLTLIGCNTKDNDVTVKNELESLKNHVEKLQSELDEKSKALEDQEEIIGSHSVQIHRLNEQINELNNRLESNAHIIQSIDSYEEIYGYYSLESGEIKIDLAEFITSDDKAKIELYSLTEDDFPNGFTIINKDVEYTTLALDSDVIYRIYDDSIITYVNQGDFIHHMRENAFMKIIKVNNKIIEIQEFYLP